LNFELGLIVVIYLLIILVSVTMLFYLKKEYKKFSFNSYTLLSMTPVNSRARGSARSG